MRTLGLESSRAGLALALVVALLTGCSSAPPESGPGGTEPDSRLLEYDRLLLDVQAPVTAGPDIDSASTGSAVAEGLGATAMSPVACIPTGIAYPLCVLASPLFPVWFAVRHQDAELSAAQLERVAAAVESVELLARLREGVEQRARRQGLPVVEGATGTARVARLVVQPGVLQLSHDGYRDGQITITQPYVFTLHDPDGLAVRRVQGKHSHAIDVASWRDQVGDLPAILEGWIADMAERAVVETVLEWRPRAVLGPLWPVQVVKRDPLGARYEEWPHLESARPHLTWQPLADVLDAEVLGQLTDVTYELEIVPHVADHRPREPDDFYYAVAGLAEPAHTVTADLLPCTAYAWRPRARFRYRGVLHTTSLRVRPWGSDGYRTDSYQLVVGSEGCGRAALRPAPAGRQDSVSRTALADAEPST